MADPVDSFTTQEEINSYLNILSQKYLANNEFIVSGTNTGIVSASVNAIAPYSNLSNRYYPTVAGLPEISDNLKTKSQLGGYFLPSNLGASIYLAKNITYTFDSNQIANGEVYHYIDPTRFNKGRGLTQNDQGNVITHTVNIDWMKSLKTSDYYDGNLLGTDTFQKFIPYQSRFETTKQDSNGVINTRYDFEFWTGPKKNVWSQTTSATQLTEDKYFNLNTKIENLVLTPGKELYSWNTDVFGNQYALYKPILTPRSLYNSSIIPGELWVKTIDGTIYTGPSALNLIYNSYINNSNVYSQLTGNSIINFEVFFDTLVIQLSGTTLYEKITFNYDNFTIEKSLQNFLPVTYGVTSSLPISTVNFRTFIGNLSPSAVTFYGGNWYNSGSKTITVCTLLSSTFTGKPGSLIDTSGLSSVIMPVLYQLDLNTPQERQRVYPLNSTEGSTFIEFVYPLSGVSYMEAPLFCFNEDTKLYFTTFITFSAWSQQVNLVNYKISAS